MTAQRRPPEQVMEAPPSPAQKSYRREKNRATPSEDSRDPAPHAGSSGKRRPSDEARRPPDSSPRSPPAPPPQTVSKFNLGDVKYYLNKKLRFLRTSERHVLIAVCVAHLKAPGNNPKQGVKTSLSPFVDDPDVFIEKMWKYVRSEPVGDGDEPSGPNDAQNGRDHAPTPQRVPSDGSVSDGRARLRRRRPNKTNRSRSPSTSSVRRYGYQESRDRRKHRERRSRRRRKRADRDRRLDRRHEYESESEDDGRGRRPRKRRRRHRYSDEESDRERYYAERDSRRYEPPPGRFGDDRHAVDRDRSPLAPHRRSDERYGERRDRSPYGRPPERRNLDDRDRSPYGRPPERRDLNDRQRSPPRHGPMEQPRDLRNALTRRPRDEDAPPRRAHEGGTRYGTDARSPRELRRSAMDESMRPSSEVIPEGDEIIQKASPAAGPGSSVDSKAKPCEDYGCGDGTYSAI
ncbi:unnamed protein product [Agarophyton chilense]